MMVEDGQGGHEHDLLRGFDPLLLVIAVVLALILAGAFL